MPKKTPPPPADVAPLTLSGTTVSLRPATGAARAKPTIHARRPPPGIPKGNPVADATPSKPVAIERPDVKTPRRP